ncbi:aspartic peptidase, partial [Tanacetum coccineum]
AYYSVNMTGIKVGTEFLNLTTDQYGKTKKTKTVIDSGTTLAYLPEMIYTPLVKKIVAGQSDMSLGLQDQYTCFKYSGRNCPSREGMEWKSFEEGLAEITETLKRLQYTLLFHQAKLKESFRQARQDFSLVRQDISLATERSIKAAIKEEVDHEEQFDFLGVQLNQRIPNRTVKARKVKARLFWRKFIVIID